MKQLITITIDAPSHHDGDQCNRIFLKAVTGARRHMDGDARIKIASTNVDDPSDMMRIMGNLKWWSLGRAKEEKKKGFWARLGEELNGVLEVDD